MPSEPGAVRARRMTEPGSPPRSRRRRAGRLPAVRVREGVPVGRQPEWYRELRLFVPGRQTFYFWDSVPAGTAKGLIARPLETFSAKGRRFLHSIEINRTTPPPSWTAAVRLIHSGFKLL